MFSATCTQLYKVLVGISDLYNISLLELVKGDSKMTEKGEKDSGNSQTNTRFIFTTGILVAVVGIIYASSLVVGGEFKDFCEAAIQWVLLGIGLAATITYISKSEQEDKISEES